MLIGQYRILEKIAEGGMGVVYKAEHVTLEQTVALKSLPLEFSSNLEMRERFIREAKIQAQLIHPNIATLYNFFEYEGNFYLVMEFTEGETVASMIRRDGRIALNESISIFKKVLTGIGYAHSRGIIHRDIKPSNIIVTPDGSVKVTDFGIARIKGDSQQTQTGSKVGTLFYMSPEQVKGQSVGITADIYSLGVTLFEMLSGKTPFAGDSEYHLMRAIVENNPPPLREVLAGISSAIEAIVMKAISKSPSERFQNTGEFLNALSSIETSSVTDESPKEPEHEIVASDSGFSNIQRTNPFRHFQNKRIFLPALSIMLGILTAFAYVIFTSARNTANINPPANPAPVMVSPTVAVPPLSSENTQQKEELTGTKERPPEGHEKSKVPDRSPLEKETVRKVVSDSKAEEKIKKIAKGSLSVASIPSAADVFVDGKYLGKTPLTTGNLIPGKVDLRIGRIDGYEDQIGTVEIIPNKTATLSISLSKLSDTSKSPPAGAGEPIRSERQVKKTGYLHVETDPQGAKVYINGNYKGLTPVELVLTSGKYTLVLIKDHYKTYSELVAMGEGAKPLSIRLSPK